ncbi:copper resistance protein CopC [Brucellaceae bacterium D45D]
MLKRTLLALMLLAGSSSPIFAHAHLSRSEPAEDATLKTPPETVLIEYTEALELDLSKLVLIDAEGKAVETGRVEHLDKNPKTLTIKLPALKPGTYKVEWEAASVDTHRTEGSFSFTVAP